MNMKTRLKRGAIGALVALLAFGAGAFADDNVSPGTDSQATVSATTLSGSRSLALAGPSLTGPAILSVNKTSAEAPFGVIVTDLAHPRQGYDVTATMSNLYLLDPSSASFTCTQSIPAGSFEVGFDLLPTTLPDTLEDVAAVVDPTLSFAGDLTDSSSLGALVSTLSSTAVNVNDLLGVTTEFTSALSFMNSGNGTNPDPADFANADEHTGCNDGEGGDGAQSRFLQTGSTATPSSTDLLNEFIAFVETAGDGAGSVSVDDVIAAGVLEANADDDGGRLFEATEAIVSDLLSGVTLPVGVTLQDVTSEVIDGMVVTTTLDLVGQTGAYVNVPKLVYTPPDSSPRTGLYQGTMTVTLTDKP